MATFGLETDASVRCEVGQAEGIVRCARKREKGQEGKEGLGLTYAADFVRRRLQMRRTPARNSAGLAASRAGGRKGDGGGGHGLLIGVGTGTKRAGSKRN
jgi:hypothetical protein